MLDPTWPWTPLVLWLLLAGLLALLVVRTALKDRREYQRFKRYRTTLKRQAMMRKWLLDSLWSIGGVAVVLLVLVWQFVGPLLTELQSWFPLDTGLTWGVLAGGLGAAVVLTALGIRSARHEPEEVATLGDVAAMLPRNRQELRLGWLMSFNAGVSEELMFRLAIPALVYGASGSAVLAVVIPLALFGVLHLYQGVIGIVSTTVIGALLLFAYIATGTILVPIVLHVLFDLRSLVLIPVALYGAHRVDGRVQKLIPKPKPKRAPAAEPETGTAPEPAIDAPEAGPTAQP